MRSDAISNRAEAFPGLIRAWDAGAILVLALLALWLFRGHISGDTLWIGNPDRLNSDLKILRHYLAGADGEGLSAWNAHEMMGYDSFVLPYTFPNPLVNLVALFGEENLFLTMGCVVAGMLFAAGLAAYAFLRALLPAGLPVLVGALCYQFSLLTILKDSQNSMSFAVFIVIPLLALGVRSVRRGNEAWCFLLLALLSGGMLSLMFLQKAAYALMLVGAYAAWRSRATRSWLPLAILVLAVAVATGFSSPRILGIGLAIAEYKRAVPGVDLADFAALYSFQNIHPYEILRWFDGSIFGVSPSDSVSLGNNINLTEGFLLSTSAIVPLLLLTGLLCSRLAWLNPFGAARSEERFFFWILVLCIAVIVARPAAHAVFLLFMRLDFTHARILIAALLPLSVLVAASLRCLAPGPGDPGRFWRQSAAGLAAGIAVALAIESIAARFPGTVPYTDFVEDSLVPVNPAELWQAPNLRADALVRIFLSAAVFLLLLRTCLRRNARLPQAAYVAICVLLASQCLIAANRQVNGPQVFEFERPFARGDSYQARREEFAPPDTAQLAALHRRIEPQRYRVALICDRNIADGFCAGHVPEYWKLRAIDGYYGLGVPRRLRALPWPEGVSLRTISFTSRDSVPWDLLGLLNVRSVLVGSDGVFRNIVREENRIAGRPDPAGFEIIPSPARVTPRAFFAAAVKPVDTPEEAAQLLFRPEGIVDPVVMSFAEGFGTAREFAPEGSVEVRGRGDKLTLDFEASPRERFLVLNELYFPGWHAEADGRTLPVLATNAVMRGVVVPPGVTSVRFRYVSYVATTAAGWGRAGAVAALLALFFFLWRRGRSWKAAAVLTADVP